MNLPILAGKAPAVFLSFARSANDHFPWLPRRLAGTGRYIAVTQCRGIATVSARLCR